MIKQSDGDVLIVGADPGGLTLANDLAVRGIPFRVIDPLPEPVREARARLRCPHSLALDKLGLVELMLAVAKQPHRSFVSISAAGWSENWTWPQRVATRTP